jgi:hypothetical protein
VTVGGEAPAHPGYFVRPTVFANVRNDMTIAREEIFGPVLSIIPYEDEDDAVRIANDTPYGLAGGVWSADAERAKRVARRLRTGQVDINGGSFNPFAPFGGYKQSGNGREWRLDSIPGDQVAADVKERFEFRVSRSALNVGWCLGTAQLLTRNAKRQTRNASLLRSNHEKKFVYAAAPCGSCCGAASRAWRRQAG